MTFNVESQRHEKINHYDYKQIELNEQLASTRAPRHVKTHN